MARPFKPIADDDHSRSADFARALRALRKEHGQPSIRDIAERSGYSVGAVQAAFAGQRLPSAAVLHAIIGALSQVTSHNPDNELAQQWEERRLDPDSSHSAGDSTAHQSEDLADALASTTNLPAAQEDQSANEQGFQSRFDAHYSRVLVVTLACAVTVVAVTVALLWLNRDSRRSALRSASAATGTTKATSKADPGPMYVVFDDLGGGSTIIDAFAGPADTTADRRITATYRSGQRKIAYCSEKGRRVSSDTSAGERHRSSMWWVKVASPDNQEPRYATMTYARLVNASGKTQSVMALKRCPQN